MITTAVEEQGRRQPGDHRSVSDAAGASAGIAADVSAVAAASQAASTGVIQTHAAPEQVAQMSSDLKTLSLVALAGRVAVRVGGLDAVHVAADQPGDHCGHDLGVADGQTSAATVEVVTSPSARVTSASGRAPGCASPTAAAQR
ncbi:hypothetical protein [Krasilnikovia sp. M28-CT-15]|uniref:hypothetical protein n=1 Tax=Krasilnikovia sp. M28-CT-15 TaxID=3373540 RepID=UPI003875E303